MMRVLSTSPDAIEKRLRRRRLPRFGADGIVGFTLLALVLIAVVFAPLVSPYDPTTQVLADAGKPPLLFGGTWEHPFGTDQLGRDVLARVLHGGRVSVLVGVVTAVMQMGLGVAIGLIAGYFGGWFDTVLMRLADVLMAIPFLVLAMAVMAVTGPGLVNTILVLVATGWVAVARVVRGEVLSLREREFILASRTLGAGPRRVMLKHLLPNVLPSVIVIGTLQVSDMIIVEASLSFLGLGIQPPTPSWGSMISEGRAYIYNEWWLATLPGLMLLVTILSINLIGDWLRDRLDPMSKGIR